MARKFHYEKGMPERTKVITFEGSFHGRSIGMISAAGSEKLTKGFGPLLPGFVQIPFGDHEALIAEIDETIAAIVIEPIQGNKSGETFNGPVHATAKRINNSEFEERERKK